MKLIYRIKFRAFGITFGTQSGEVGLGERFPNLSDGTLVPYIPDTQDNGMVTLVNDRGVYIGVLVED